MFFLVVCFFAYFLGHQTYAACLLKLVVGDLKVPLDVSSRVRIILMLLLSHAIKSENSKLPFL